MKISGYELFFVAPRWLFLKIETDEGIVGWGEPVLEAKALTVAAAVDEMMDHIMGKDPMQIERHWQRMMKGGFYRGGGILNSAVAGIDQALWDIAGKKLGVPVYQLLGGPVRDRARIYGHIGGHTSKEVYGIANAIKEKNEMLESVQLQLERGLTALKWCPADALEHIDTPVQVKRIVENVEAVRNHVGDEIDLCAPHHRAHDDRVFSYAARGHAIDRGQLEDVTVNVHRMLHHAHIAERDAIALAALDRERRRCRRRCDGARG